MGKVHKETYEEFLSKFDKKKTSDDCFTPKEIYEKILFWAYGLFPLDSYDYIVRPFYPGGDYQNYKYPQNCVVIDNPPFSIFAKIVRFYIEKNIPFLLFAPGLTSIRENTCFISCDVKITYENGALIRTDFITNMLPKYRCITAPELRHIIEKKNFKKTKNLYPKNIIRASNIATLSRKNIYFSCLKEESEVEEVVTNYNKKEFGKSILVTEEKYCEFLDKLYYKGCKYEDIVKSKGVDVNILDLNEKAKNTIKILNGR